MLRLAINGDLTAVTVGHHLHAGLQEVGGRQLEGLAPPHQHGQSDQVFTYAVPQGLVGVSTGPHGQTGLHLLGRRERPVVMNDKIFFTLTVNNTNNSSLQVNYQINVFY